jgi:hypothetical protein
MTPEEIEALKKLVLDWQFLANQALYYMQNDKSWNTDKENLDKRTQDAGIEEPEEAEHEFRENCPCVDCRERRYGVLLDEDEDEGA